MGGCDLELTLPGSHGREPPFPGELVRSLQPVSPEILPGRMKGVGEGSHCVSFHTRSGVNMPQDRWCLNVRKERADSPR
jgi:hypothetical protein